jgi:aryl-alcohol dehydrogenase-like predicted oxidoreductase
MMRLILGTAQLGLNYGIANATGIPNAKDIDQIFMICKNNGINYCDTAYAYGASHKLVKSRGIKIITKLSLGDPLKTKLELEKLSSEFDGEALDTVLVHNPKCLFDHPKNWEELQHLKQNNQFKIGVSVYTPQEAYELLNLQIVPDVIQIPYNIFDQKFDAILPELKNLGIEIHARSLFLQGLFFLNLSEIPKNIELLVNPMKVFNDFCNNDPSEKMKNALHFVLHNQWIDKLILGVEKPYQLLELIDCYNSYDGNISSFDYQFDDTQKHLLNPTNW